MNKIKYHKVIKTRARSDSKIEKWKAEQRKLALAIVLLEDKELLKLLAE